MTFSFSTDIVGTGANFVYQFKTLLKSVGWTVNRSSDSSTYNSSGDQISSGSSGAGGLANTNAWFIISHPLSGSQRSFCFQRGSTNSLWRIKYSFSSRLS